ncbi:hypothetical protein [Stenotrophomonas oahuensis]|uniref:Lipoprotein n=1 Tax=Stenotrophomonas oahuensis TaxID=3003271 RepID=A0ABY9YU73_9GAMM|nr:hypothetical protein [Stenotrophomonas sp. A5586]WNH54549.1 hypothetical protein PDM29_09820 [Stenotrophomonas sp. A5586]
MRALPCLLLFPLALLAGCDKRNGGDTVFSADPMLGCYATHPRKAADFRIDQEQGRYYVSFNRDEQWQREATPLQEAKRDEVASYFPSDADQIDRALVRNSGGFGLFHLKSNATLRGKAKDSDYMTLVLIGAGPVFRTGCD